jgi:hypothetical protein
VTSSKPIAILSQSTSDVNAVNPLVAFFCSIPDTRQELKKTSDFLQLKVEDRLLISEVKEQQID